MTRPTKLVCALTVAALLVAGCARSSAHTTTDSASGDRAASLKAGDFGTMQSVCGPATGKNRATGRGVTADAIRLGVISDAGYPGSPGLNEELWDASDVFTKWCNSLGGINGRRIIDAHLDAAALEYRQVVLEACQNDFALVGGGSVLDDAGQKNRLQCLLPAWPAFLLTPVARNSELQWSAISTPLQQLNDGGYKWLLAKYPDSKGSIGYLTANTGGTIVTKQQEQETFGLLGANPASGGYDDQYNALGESSWVPFASRMKDAGVKGLVWVGEPHNLAKLEQAMLAIGYHPEWVMSLPNIYTPDFSKSLGSGAIPTYAEVSSTPFEVAGQDNIAGRAISDYLSLFRTYLPNGRSHADLGIVSFASWLLFAQGAKACGANLTPRCMYDQMQRTTKFTAGGLVGQREVAAAAPTQCFTVVEAVPNGFKVMDVHPNSGDVFNCSPSNLVTLHGNYGQGVTLASVGKSVKDLP